MLTRALTEAPRIGMPVRSDIAGMLFEFGALAVQRPDMIRLILVALIGASLSTPSIVQSKALPIETAINAQAEVRQIPQATGKTQAILDAADICDAWMTTAEDNELDELTPYQQSVKDAVAAISTLFVDAKTHSVDGRPAYRALNEAPDIWLDEGHAGCSLSAAEGGGRERVLNMLRPAVLALLSEEGSTWSPGENNQWVRPDGWALSLGEDTREAQTWSVERTY